MQVKKLFTAAAAGIFLLYALLIVSAFFFFDAPAFHKSLHEPRVLHAVFTSLLAASLATVIAVMLAIPAAYALSRFSFRLKSAVDLMLEFPMIISPAALGALLLIFFQTPAGTFFREQVSDIVYTFWAIVIAQFVTILGISTRLIKAVFDEIPVRYEHIARTLGATQRKAFLSVSLPLARKGIVAAIVLTWAKAIGEFGATITLAGSMPMKTETLPTAIFMHLSMADIKGSVSLIVLLLCISLPVLIITRLLIKRRHA